jgi:NSS family neurotransmitter:Na+ symporter
LLDDLETPYGDYPQWMLLTFGWGAAVAVVVVGFAAARIPWRSGTSLAPPDDELTGGR